MLTRLFPNNEHVVERAVRIIIGFLGIALVFVGPQSAWGWLGVVPLATGLIGSCPLYTLMGISTCAMKPKGPASA